MPIIKPEIQQALRDAGLTDRAPSDELTIQEHLAQAGLSDAELAEELVELAKHSGNESLRLRALETAAKIKGALKEAPPSIPSFTIILQSASSDSPVRATNPILFPRQSLKDEKEQIN